jgi:hypothetical protein
MRGGQPPIGDQKWCAATYPRVLDLSRTAPGERGRPDNCSEGDTRRPLGRSNIRLVRPPHEELHLVFLVEHDVERSVMECHCHQLDALTVVKGGGLDRMPGGGVVGIAFQSQPCRPSLDLVVEESVRGTAERIESHDCECVTQRRALLVSSHGDGASV